MDDETLSEAAAWLRKARRDLNSAQRLLQGVPPYLDTAFIIANKPPKRHSKPA